MHNSIYHRTIFVVRISRAKRRLNAICDFVESLSPTRRIRLKQLVKSDLAAIRCRKTDSAPADRGLTLRACSTILDAASRDTLLDSTSVALRIRAVARWVVTVFDATADSEVSLLQELHRRSCRALEEIGGIPHSADPGAWFNVDAKLA